MPINKKQVIRLVKLAAELKENRYPNAKSFSDKLKKADLDDNLNIACGERTILRDIQVLKTDFDAPIKFDKINNGFYLRHHGWNFQCPILEEELMLSLIVGARLAEEMLPSPVKGEIRQAMDEQLTCNNPDFLDTAFIDSLIIASTSKVTVEATIFKSIFVAWHSRRIIKIQYANATGELKERLIEPHALSYHNTIWYTKAFCHLSEQLKVFAIHRIKSVEITTSVFDINTKISKDIKKYGLFDYPRIENVRLHCQQKTVRYLKEQAISKNLTLEEQEDGSLIVTIPSVIEYELLHWVLGEAGEVKVLSPQILVDKVIDAAKFLLQRHQETGKK